MQHLMFSTQFKPRIHDLYPSVSHSESEGGSRRMSLNIIKISKHRPDPDVAPQA